MFRYNRRQFLQATGGFPLDKKRLDHLYFTTLEDEPIPEPPRNVEAGKLFSQVPQVPFGIVIKMPVTGFGEVYLYGDNEGKGYRPADFPLDINLTCARSRLYRVSSFIEQTEKRDNSSEESLNYETTMVYY
jgi:endo-1,4-beta-xylanase